MRAVNDSVTEKLIIRSLNYLKISQAGDSVQGAFAGEWPSFIYNTSNIPFLGKKGKAAYDSNLFNTLFIHNMLAEMYLRDSRYEDIPAMLMSAQKSFVYYKSDCSYNFWPELERPAHLKCSHPNCKQRRPKNFVYYYGFINNYANIYDDADDTAAALLALFYSDSLLKQKFPGRKYNYSNNCSWKFTSYRDTGVRKTNWYNKRLGFNYRTGAFLTWFGPDKKHSNFFTWFFPSHKNQNILYGRNEVDCVVNANILRTLVLTGDTTLAGAESSKLFLKSIIKKDVCNTCGVYYPTEFSFHYAISKAIYSGLTGFDHEKNILIEKILRSRNKHGYWTSDLPDNDVQSTLFAINSLLFLSGKEHLNEIEAALGWIMANAINEGAITYWKGGVFFSGGSSIRYEHVWISDAYTTALALEALTYYLKIKKG